jgi:hypothetical protein
MKKIFSINKLLVLGLLFLCLSCEKAEYDKEYSATYPISGDWTVKVAVGTNVVSGPFFMKIYNTSFSKDSVWVDDNKAFWQTKTKAKVDMKNLTFSATNALNEYYDSQVTYSNGKVIGNDSIYFEVKYSDDPDNLTYVFSGHRKLSYEEYNTH